MTSREITFGFEFWSRDHLRMAVMHLAIYFFSRYLYPVQSYWHFSKIKDGGRHHLGFVWVSHGSGPVLGGFYPQNLGGTSFRPTKGTSLSGTTRFEPSLVQIWRTVRPVALAKKTKKRKKKKKKTVANWLFAQTTHVAVPKSKFACRVASGV